MTGMLIFVLLGVLAAIVLAVYTFSTPSTGQKEKSMLEDNLMEKEKEIFVLREEVERVKAKLSGASAAAAGAASDSNDEILKAENDNLKSKLINKEKENNALKLKVAQLEKTPSAPIQAPAAPKPIAPNLKAPNLTEEPPELPDEPDIA